MADVDIDFRMPDLHGKLKKKWVELELFIAAQMQTNRGMLFDSEGAYNGHQRWAPLVLRSGMVLSGRGVLRKSIAPPQAKGKPGPDGIVRFEADSVTIGTSLMYARMMNDGTVNMPGGVLRPVNAKALMIPLPRGAKASEGAKSLRKSKKKSKTITGADGKKQRVIFRKSVKIPPRPFDTWTQEDENELNAALTVKVAEVLNG